MNSNEALIQEYLEDEKKLLETWYINRMTRKMDISDESEFRSNKLPSIEDIREKFLTWVIKNKVKLRYLICEKFDYINKKHTFKTTVDIVSAIMEVLNTEYTNSLEISSLLVITGLDNLCL